jgi:hypothetical protein
LRTDSKGGSLLGDYGRDLRGIILSPRRFFGEVFPGRTDRAARWFACLNGWLMVAMFFLLEVLTGGRVTWTLLLAVAMGAILAPFAMPILSALWAAFMGLTARLLGEELDPRAARKTTDYATVGLLPLALGYGWLAFLALSVVVYQILGLERAQSCSRLKAFILAGFPFLLFLTLMGMAALIFKTRVF